MIDIKDLRIGNYTFVENKKNHLEIYGIPLIVTRIGFNDVGLDLLKPINGFYCESFSQLIKFVKPIPLIEDWLVKFGKTKYGLLIQPSNYPSGDLYVDFANNSKNCMLRNCCDGYEFGKEIKYVHQLQNLYFALTGQELAIKE